MANSQGNMSSQHIEDEIKRMLWSSNTGQSDAQAQHTKQATNSQADAAAKKKRTRKAKPQQNTAVRQQSMEDSKSYGETGQDHRQRGMATGGSRHNRNQPPPQGKYNIVHGKLFTSRVPDKLLALL